MLVRDIMKQNPCCVSEQTTVADAARAMAQIGCGVLPVTAASAQDQYHKAPIGVVTDRDMVVRCLAAGRDPATARIGEFYSPETFQCRETTTSLEAFKMMRQPKVGRLLVMDEGGKLCGIVTMADILGRVPAEVWEQLPGAKTPMPRNTVAA